MKYAALTSLLLTSWLAGPVAAADNHIVDLTTRYGDDAFEVGFRAEAPLAAPRVRSSAGFVRVWFPELGSVELNGDVDGDAIRFVSVRPGYGDTNVAIIRLGDGRTLPLSAITTVVDGARAYVRIDRQALPAVGSPADSAEVVAEAEASDLIAADPIADVTAEPTATDAETETETESESAAPSPRPELALASPTPAGPLPSGGSPMLMLVLLTVLLGLAYLGIRWFGKHRTRGPRRNIEIIANKRIGARHQLVVVRALGEDHLLAIHGGRTEKIASMPCLDEASESDGGRRREDASDLLPFLRLGGGSRADSDHGVDDDGGRGLLHRASESPKRIEERPRFGAELMKLVGERADRVSVSAPPSEAVAGLLRLREKLGR